MPVTPDAFQSQVTVDRRRSRRALRQEQGVATASARSARSGTRWSTSIRCAQTSPCPRPTSRRSTSRTSRSTTTPAQVRASHILFKTEGKDENAVQAQAEDVLKRAKAPAPTSPRSPSSTPKTTRTTTNGGDLDYFGRGRMVPEFEAGGVRDEERRDQRPGEDVVRLPHHQDGGQPGRGRRGRSPRCAPRSRIS